MSAQEKVTSKATALVPQASGALISPQHNALIGPLEEKLPKRPQWKW